MTEDTTTEETATEASSDAPTFAETSPETSDRLAPEIVLVEETPKREEYVTKDVSVSMATERERDAVENTDPDHREEQVFFAAMQLVRNAGWSAGGQVFVRKTDFDALAEALGA